MKEGKLVIFSAPSGAGKTTIVKHLLSRGLNFGFSISATTRKPRGEEIDGKDYYFLTNEEFKKRIDKNEFLEWEEVYPGCLYGTLRSEVDRICKKGQNILFDVDVEGGSNIKKHYGNRALAVFVQPPSIEELENRLITRSTDNKEMIIKRVEKARYELGYSALFDLIIVNDQLEDAFREAEEKIRAFIGEGAN